jgi:hypothetical protein
MLTYSLILIYILLASWNLALLSNQKLAQTIPIGIFFAIIWTSTFGMFDKLYLGLLLLLPFTIFLAIILFFLKKPPKVKSTLRELFSLPVAFFVVASAWTFSHSMQMQFYDWDEFTHWGTSVKSMFLFDQLGALSPAYTNNPNYPPGLSVLGYITARIGGTWDESDVIWTYQLIFISMLIPVLSKFTIKKIGYFSASLVTLLLSSVVFYDTLQTVYADPILAIAFGFLLILATAKSTNLNWTNFGYFLLTLSAFILIKDFAIVLSLVPILLVGVNYLVTNNLKTISKQRLITISVFRSLTSASVVVLTRFTWNSFTSTSSGQTGPGSVIADAPSRFGALFSTDQNYVRELALIFRGRVFNGTLTPWSGISLSTFQWILIITFFLAMSTFSSFNKLNQKSDLIFSLIIVLGSLGYLLSLFLVYLTVYSGGMASALTSYERYASTYFGGVLFYIAAQMVHQIFLFSESIGLHNSGQSRLVKIQIPAGIVLFFLLLTFYAPNGRLTTYAKNPSEFSAELRSGFENIKNKIRFAKFTELDKVGIIAQHTMGFEYYVLQYESLPASVVPTGNYTWSIGSPSGENDYWTDQAMNPERWNTYLSKLDYLIVFKVSDSFLDEFGQFFEDPPSTTEQGIYRVEHSGTKNILLRHL